MSARAAYELERKFLPDPESPDLQNAIARCTPDERLAVRQGYVLRAGDEGEVRLRETIRAGQARRIMTVKRGAMPERREAEIEITAEQWDILHSLVIGTEIRKERFLVTIDSADTGGTERSPAPADSVIAEIDRFIAPCPGLVLIEVEFPSPDACAAFVPPVWFGRDVTEDRRYRNQEISRKGADEIR